jgi:hypothetical protein
MQITLHVHDRLSLDARGHREASNWEVAFFRR